MASHPSRDQLEREFRRQRLPSAYIERLLAELGDHYEDLLEERSTSMGAARKLQTEQSTQDDLQQRLGEPAKLALFAGEQYHARSFWGRHPWVTYVLGPLPLLVVMWVLYLAAIWIPTYCIGSFGEHMGWWTESGADSASTNYLLAQAVVLACFTWGLAVLPPFGAALALCRVYRRNTLDRQWPIVGCTLLAIVAAALHISWRLHTGDGPNERGMIMFGIMHPITLRVLGLLTAKFTVAMGIGLLLVKRAQQRMEVDDLGRAHA
jgi:hypothetical protein